MDTLTPRARATFLSGAWTVPDVLAAVGQHRDDPDHLLLLGDDGRYYDLRLTDGATLPISAGPGDEWLLDPGAEPVEMGLRG